MHVLTTRGNNDRVEKFIIMKDGEKFQAVSFNGYKSQAEGKTLKEVIRDIEALEEVEATGRQLRTSPMYQYKFFPEYDHTRIYVTYTLNSKLSDAELSATIALVEYDHGGEMILYSEEKFAD